MRAKLPGNKEPQELLVPAGMGMISYNAAVLGTRPTKESIEGATIGTEKITTKGGSFTAKHIRFGAGSGNLDPEVVWAKLAALAEGAEIASARYR